MTNSGHQLHILHKVRDQLQDQSRLFFYVRSEFLKSITSPDGRIGGISFIRARLLDAAISDTYTYFHINPDHSAVLVLREIFSYCKREAIRKCKDDQPGRRSQLADTRLYLVWDGVVIYSSQRYNTLIKQEKQNALFKSRKSLP